MYNRRSVDDQLPRLLAAGAAQPVTVALLELDHFKHVNDTCSHEVGDRVLCAVAEVLQDAAASVAGDGGSFAARMGGEEFLLVLVGPDAATAADRLEDVRATIRAHDWAGLTGDVPVTVSVGAASFTGLPDTSVAQLFGRADGHLYPAKRVGRDRVVSDTA